MFRFVSFSHMRQKKIITAEESLNLRGYLFLFLFILDTAVLKGFKIDTFYTKSQTFQRT